MKKILVATDITPHADRAMARAVTLACESGAILHVINVVPVYPLKKPKSFAQIIKPEIEDSIKKQIYALRGSRKLNYVIKIVQASDAYQEILKYAHSIKTDLIVMGMHRKSKLHDLFVGTTIERVIRKSLKPVLMVKNISENVYKNVLCGVDFSSGSRAALRAALHIAPYAKFHVIHAYEIPYYAESTYEYAISQSLVEEKHKEKLDRFLAEEFAYFKKRLPKSKIKLSGHLVPGKVQKVLVNKAKSIKAELMVIGAHGEEGFVLPSSKLGGSAKEILTHPPCDVLVVDDWTDVAKILI